MGAVEGGVGFLEVSVFGFEGFELAFKVLDVLFFAFAEGALGGAVLGAAALGSMSSGSRGGN